MSVSDDDLLELVGRALHAADPVPDHVLDGAHAAWTWRTIDEELAELVFELRRRADQCAQRGHRSTAHVPRPRDGDRGEW